MARRIEFIPNVARKTQGLTGSNVEQFRDDPYRSCARETGQNSNDARLIPDKASSQAAPVRLEYNLLEISMEDLPFADQLQPVITACLDQSRKRGAARGKDPDSHQEVRFFDRAEKTLAAPTIRVLEIADYNTTGLTGPFDDQTSVFNSLVKADGDNNKQNADSGGSFGIGKNAAFAVSDLQTVLYSTLTETDGKDAFGCQARLQLISHELDGHPFSAEGYWGEEDFYAITDPAGLPDWIVRRERGASIFAIGFRWHENWAERMAVSAITNFLLAIMRGQMEFSIDKGRIPINRGKLAGYLADRDLERIAEETGQREALARTRDLHACLTSGLCKTTRLATGGGQGAHLHILVSEELKQPRTVLFIRNGMYITDNLRDFGYAFKTFSGTKPFIAVVEPTDDSDGKTFSEFLKKMENPEHDNFSPERLRDDTEIKAARKLVRKLEKDIRAHIRDAAGVVETETTSIDELAKYFQGDPQPDDNSKAKERDPERFRTGRAKKSKPKPLTPQTAPGDAGGAGSSGGKSGGGGGGSGASTGTGSGGRGTRSPAQSISLSAKRCRREKSAGGFTHRIYFTPDASGKAAIRLDASGLTSPSPLRISAAEAGRIAKGLLVLEMTAGERQSVAVSFAESYDGPVDIVSFALTEETSP